MPEQDLDLLYIQPIPDSASSGEDEEAESSGEANTDTAHSFPRLQVRHGNWGNPGLVIPPPLLKSEDTVEDVDDDQDDDWEPYRRVSRSDPRLRYYHDREVETVASSDDLEMDYSDLPAPAWEFSAADEVLIRGLADAVVTYGQRNGLSYSEARSRIQAVAAVLTNTVFNELVLLLQRLRAYAVASTVGVPRERPTSSQTSDASFQLQNMRLRDVMYQDLIGQHPTDELLDELLIRMRYVVRDHWGVQDLPLPDVAALWWLHLRGIVHISEELIGNELLWGWRLPPRWEDPPINEHSEMSFASLIYTNVQERHLSLSEKHLGRACVADMRLCW